MKGILRAALTLFVITLSLSSAIGYAEGSSCETGHSSEEKVMTINNEPAIEQFLADFQNAYNTHDPLMVANFYVENARWQAAAGPVFQGREVIAGALEYFMTHVPPTLTLNEQERIVIGDHAASLGTYVLSGEVSGTSRSISGAYLNLLRKDGESWQIIAQQMNYAFNIPDDWWVGKLEAVAALAEEGTFEALVKTSESLYNQDDLSALTASFSEDAVLAFPGSPLVKGRDAVSRALQEGRATPQQLEIHDLSTWRLGEMLAVDSGWFELTDATQGIQWGTYLLLAKQTPEGQWEVQWLVSTGTPSTINSQY